MVLFRSNKGMALDLNSNALAYHAQFAELDAHNSRCRIPQPRARPKQRFQVGERRGPGDVLESSPGTFRGFCRVCGSPIVNKFDERSRSAAFRPAAVSECGIALATLDDDPDVRPGSHIFVADKAPWFEITDGLPQHQGVPLPR